MTLDAVPDEGPEFLVGVPEEDDEAIALAVEGRGRRYDDLVDDLFEAGVGHGRRGGQRIVRAAILHGVEEGRGVGGSRHGLCVVCGASVKARYIDVDYVVGGHAR